MGYTKKKTTHTPTEGESKATTDATSSRWLFRVRPLAIVGVIVILAGGIWWWLSSSENTQVAVENSAKSKKAKPQHQQRSSVTVTQPTQQSNPPSLPKDKRRDIKGNIIDIPKNPWGQPIPPELEYKPIWEYTTEDYAKIDPGYLARHEAHKARQEAIPWKTDADRQLAILLFAKDGNMGLLTPFNWRFKEQFLKSIETPIIATKDDPPELQEQKRQMNEVKIWLKERMDNGEDIVEILNSEYRNAQKVRTLRKNLQDELRKIEKTATSVQEVQEYIDAANKMLDEYGASHVGLPLTLTRLRLEKEATKQP